ncbi:MAG: hypothetical protein C0394_05045 [Syntrophus sp. (in: bacteria)]|nr:hypothetical protein [Syntrophus sp. (in: bacteria)]
MKRSIPMAEKWIERGVMDELCADCRKHKFWTPCKWCGKPLCDACAQFELLAEGCGTVVPAYFCATCVIDPFCNPNAMFRELKETDVRYNKDRRMGRHKIKNKLSILAIFSILFLFSAEVVSAAEMETFAQSVANAKANAAAPTGWVATDADMFKVSTSGSVGANPYGLQYYGNPANNQLIVRTVSTERAYNGYYWPNVPTTAGSNYSIYGNKDVMSAWVTTGKEMTGFIDGRGLTAGTAVKGLERGLGMNATGTHDAIFETAVTVSDTANPYLLRPTRNPNPTTYSTNPADHGTNAVNIPANAAAAGIGAGAAAEAVYANYKAAYTAWMTSNYPWTQLGYTYYWGQAANKPANLSDVQGMSEFILLGNTGNSDPNLTPSGTNESGKVVVVGIYATQSYLYTKNNGTTLSDVAGAQYGNGFASFNVTGPCDTLWAGAAFQVGTSMDAASPNTITVGAGGNVSGGQGILVGSQNYTVTNAGFITANADKKKFNLTGSENIALLFKGDTHTSPYVGAVKNILINSGTITAPGNNGTAVMALAGNTDIINTGTITGSGNGYAIRTGAGNDTLTINGGEIAGKVDLGAGVDVLSVTAGSSAKFTFTLNSDAPAAAQIKSQTVSIADNTTTVAVKTTGTTNIKNNEQFLIADTTTLMVDPAKLTIQNDPSLPMVTFSAGKSGNQLLLTALRNTAFYGRNSGSASLGAVLDALAGSGNAGADMQRVIGALDTSGAAANAARLQPVVDNGILQTSRAAMGGFLGAVAGRLDNLRSGQSLAHPETSTFATLGAALNALAGSGNAGAKMQRVIGALDASGAAANASRFQPVVDNGRRAVWGGLPGADTGRMDHFRYGQSLADAGNAIISTGGASGDKGLWARGLGSWLHQGARDASKGYDATVWGVATGYDVLLREDLRFGGGFGYAKNRIKSNDNGGDADSDSLQGTLYAALTKKAGYLNGSLSVAFNSYRSSRQIVFPGVNRTANSEYDGQQYSLYLEGGHVLKTGGLTWTPLASIQYEHLRLDGYTEKNAGDLNLKVNGQNYNMALTGLGLKLGYAFQGSYGTFLPELHVKWLYDLMNDHQQSTATFTGGGASFTTSGFTPARSSYHLGTKISLITGYNIELSVDYDFEYKNDFYGHSGYVNIRYAF